MRILKVITSMDPEMGGLSQGLRNLVPALSALGVKTDVVSLDDPESGFLKKDAFTIHAIGKAKGPWAMNPNLEPWLFEHINEYDAVIVHGLWQYPVYAVRKTMARLKAIGVKNLPKVFLMPHGMLDPYFQKADNRKIKAIRNYFYWKLMESKNVSSADGLLFTCEEEMRLAALSFSPYKPKSTINVSFGIQSPPERNDVKHDLFYNAFPFLKDREFLLFLSRIHVKKGADILVEAYKKVYGDQEKPPYLLIAGPGADTDYGKQIIELVNGDDFLKKHVVFVGMLQGDMKWAAFYNCEAFVLPSHQENFGIAVAEALACSKPVVITDKVNIYKEISAADAGIVASDTLNDTIESLRKWKDMSAVEKSNMGANAYNLFQNVFKVEAAAKKFLMELEGKLKLKNA